MSSYLVEVSVCLLVLYTAFLLLFRQDTGFLRNRFYLVLAPVVSFVLPILSFELTGEVGSFVGDVIPFYTTQTGASDVMVVANEELNLISIVYWTGFTLTGLFLCFRIAFMYWKMRKYEKDSIHGMKAIITNGAFPTSVFFNTLLWDNSQSLTSENEAAILAHEKAHIEQNHWFDLLLVQFVKMLLWFNPIIYLLEASIKQQHEFLANRAAVSRTDQCSYEQLMVDQVFGTIDLGLTSSFGQPTVTNRLRILNGKSSARQSWLRSILAIPFVVLIVFLYSCDPSIDPSLEGLRQADNGDLFLKYELVEIENGTVPPNGHQSQQNATTYSGKVYQVRGTVTTKDGSAQPGTNVVFKGAPMGTVTDMDGNFMLNLTEDLGTLIFSFIGFEILEVDVQ